VSADGGATWSTGTDLLIHPTSQGLRDGMNGIAAVTDSGNKKAALVMVFETNPKATFNIEYAVSYDDGATWGNRNTVYVPASGKNAGAPQITLVGSRLVAVFMTDESTSTQDWPNVADVKTVSAAGGLVNGKITWDTTAQLVSSSPSHWPGVITIGTQAFSFFDNNAIIEGKLITF
jgi:Neuraminidase (sialidase)